MENTAHSFENRQLYNFATTLLLESQNRKKRDRTRAAIHAAGCALLDHQSLISLTVSEICHEAQIAHGTFYIYFSDRQAFVADLLLRFVDFVQLVMHQASKSIVKDPVRATTAAYYVLFENNPGLMKCLLNNLEDFPETREAFQKLNREWVMTVVRATERRLTRTGRLADISHDELLRRTYALGGMIDQYLSALFLNNDETLALVSKDREAVIDTLTDIWKRGMAV